MILFIRLFISTFILLALMVLVLWGLGLSAWMTIYGWCKAFAWWIAGPVTISNAIWKYPAVEAGTWIALIFWVFILAMILALLLKWLIRKFTSILGSIAAHSLALLVIFASIAIAVLQWIVMFGAVSIQGYVLIPMWNPPDIENWMMLVFIIAVGLYPVIEMLPIALSGYIGLGLAVLNMLSSAANIFMWIGAMGAVLFSSSFILTKFKLYGLISFALIVAFEVLLITLIQQIRVRGWIVQRKNDDADDETTTHHAPHMR